MVPQAEFGAMKEKIHSREWVAIVLLVGFLISLVLISLLTTP